METSSEAAAARHAENQALAEADGRATALSELTAYDCGEWIDGGSGTRHHDVGAAVEAGGVDQEPTTNADHATTEVVPEADEAQKQATRAIANGEQQAIVTLSALKRAMILRKPHRKIAHSNTSVVNCMQAKVVQSWHSRALAATKSRRAVQFWLSQMRAAINAVATARRAAAAACDSDSPSDSADIGKSIAFTGGCGDPDTFVHDCNGSEGVHSRLESSFQLRVQRVGDQDFW